MITTTHVSVSSTTGINADLVVESYPFDAQATDRMVRACGCFAAAAGFRR